ncbi:chromate efflux transporter [Pelagibacterium sp. 26DY04]|uniref:chromate efflux transporter n=1 Tax=Pelagibacterium sp. 26DY04 TaxID=2967130 RepID=UPI002814EBF4|nr:chromate efflux transporter [Pelagibacterium sp. 26DY04]WMT88043.1 chromate efflux transporter [Pelagibacterium sp. 26DY04]
MTGHTDDPSRPAGNAVEVLLAFLKLGLTAFGGPIAHLGYFRDEFVTRRRWLTEAAYADLVALCQFLPGPASSQVGFGLGLMRAGPLGALAAFLAFTLPSALLMVAFAFGAAMIDGPIGSGILTGLKIVAVAIVAQAVWGMAKSLTPDRQRATIAVLAVLLVVALGGSAGQIAAIVFGAVAGYTVCRDLPLPEAGPVAFPVSQLAGFIALALFFVLLFALPLLSATSQPLAMFDAFYRSGSLVFGGGHVVLPLLQAETVAPGWVREDAFLAGYGAAQAMPGPLFTFAAYLGAVLGPEPNGVAGAAIALAAIFLPGFLLLVGILPFWNQLSARPWARAAMAGTNAAVVGILGAALYDPVFTSAITSPGAFALALVCFALLMVWKAPPWLVVIVAALGGILI